MLRADIAETVKIFHVGNLKNCGFITEIMQRPATKEFVLRESHHDSRMEEAVKVTLPKLTYRTRAQYPRP